MKYFTVSCQDINTSADVVPQASIYSMYGDRRSPSDTQRRNRRAFLTGIVVLQGGRGQQGVVVWQRPDVEHVQAWNERGRRAVDPLLLRGLHALRRVQDGR